ncbi:MAG TPA: hypothetical protein VIK30_10080, partial [Polyangia bacterium]
TEVISAIAEMRVSELPTVTAANALRHLLQRTVDAETARDLRIGRRVAWERVTTVTTDAAEMPVCVLDGAGELVAVAERRPDGLARTIRVFGRGPETTGEKSVPEATPNG